jgi:alpha-ribazole phosphatase
MLEVILVRHGETDSNVEGRYLGLTDVSLNENGINQALGLKDKLKDIRIDYVYSSPLKRCRETAGIINEAHNSAVLYSDDLKERNFGLFENLTYEEICNKYPVQKDLWENDWVNYRIEYGESALEFHKRICSFTDGILRQKHMGVMLRCGTLRLHKKYNCKVFRTLESRQHGVSRLITVGLPDLKYGTIIL